MGGGSWLREHHLNTAFWNRSSMLGWDFSAKQFFGVTHAPISKPNKIISSPSWAWVEGFLQFVTGIAYLECCLQEKLTPTMARTELNS